MELSELYGIFLIDFGRGNRIEMHIVGSYFLLNMEGGGGGGREKVFSDST